MNRRTWLDFTVQTFGPSGRVRMGAATPEQLRWRADYLRKHATEPGDASFELERLAAALESNGRSCLDDWPDDEPMP